MSTKMYNRSFSVLPLDFNSLENLNKYKPAYFNYNTDLEEPTPYYNTKQGWKKQKILQAFLFIKVLHQHRHLQFLHLEKWKSRFTVKRRRDPPP